MTHIYSVVRRVAVAMAIVFVAVSCVGTAPNSAGKAVLSVLTMPTKWTPSALLCTPRAVLVVSNIRKGADSSSPRGFLSSTGVARWDFESGVARSTELGDGVFIHASRAHDGTLFIVRTILGHDRRETTHVMRSSDDGLSWEPWDSAPQNLYGIDFESPDKGYVWTHGAIQRSSDSGGTWQTIAWPRPISTAISGTVIDADGAVWMTGGRRSEAGDWRWSIVRVLPDLTIQTIVEPSGTRWSKLVRTEAGRIFVIGTHDGEKTPRLFELAASKPPRLVYTVPEGDVKSMDVLDGRLGLLISELKGFSVKRVYLTSSDFGKTWIPFSLPDQRIHMACLLTDDRVGLLGISGNFYTAAASH